MKTHTWILAVIVSVGCAQKPVAVPLPEERARVDRHELKPPAMPPASRLARQIAAESEASSVIELSFERGRDQLEPAEAQTLNARIEAARKRHGVATARLVVWAEEEYPSQSRGRLAAPERELAERRATTLSSLVSSLAPGVKVERYNMAVRAGVFQRVIASREARVKQAFENAGVPNTDTHVRVPGKAGRAIIFLF